MSARRVSLQQGNTSCLILAQMMRKLDSMMWLLGGGGGGGASSATSQLCFVFLGGVFMLELTCPPGRSPTL
jgi:hypothetical protein